MAFGPSQVLGPRRGRNKDQGLRTTKDQGRTRHQERRPAKNNGGTRKQKLRTRDYFDSFDDIAFENLIDDLDAVQHLREHGVLVIEARVVYEVDEDLRVAGIVASRRDAG